MDSTEQLIAMVQGPAAAIDLGRGALLLADADHQTDIEGGLRQLDELAAGCPEATLDGMRRHLFEDLGFTGETTNYHAPANSFLDSVLERRRGLPITLCVVTLEVGRRLSVALDGVGMPGHFLVGHRQRRDVFIDPFDNGALLDRGACERRFRAIAGPDAPFLGAYLEPVSSTAILARMAGNLVAAYRGAADRRGLRWSARLRSRFPDIGGAELVHLAQALAHTGAHDEAAELYDRAAALLPDPSADQWRNESVRQRARLN